ncbi:MAG TPA: ScpA family protein [Actinomycetales bacterium]|nr:ScpA family protein [Actinomycetales bacterium]
MTDPSTPPAVAAVEDGSSGSETTRFPLLTGRGRSAPFEVHLDVFEGPFDLLLGLIGKHKLDITEVALARVTDEFVAHIRANGTEWDLGQASEFLVVAATLLDLKAARLLPSASVEDEEDLALLEARDLLFARLLQYRAFKQVADVISDRMVEAGRRHARDVSLEPHFASLLPELVMSITPDQLAAIAARALAPKVVPTVGLEHLHAPAVSVREQAAVIVGRLRRQQSLTFRTLTSDADSTLVVVARFLALLELFRDGSVAFEQITPLGELTIRWTGSDAGDVAVSDEFDETDRSQPPAGAPGTDGTTDETTEQT